MPANENANQQGGALLPARKLAERYDICTKTVDRWVETGILPDPVRIRGRKYWPADTEPRRDR